VSKSSDEANRLAEVVDELCDECNGQSTWIMRRGRRAELPSRDTVNGMVEDLRSVLFPGYFGTSDLSLASLRFHVGATLDRVLKTLQEQVRRGLCFVCEQGTEERCAHCEADATEITHTLLKRLPAIRKLLSHDVQAAYEGDPAASSGDEAVFCYPGIQAITNYRIAHELYRAQVPLIPRMITEYAHNMTGIDIHPGAKIEQGLFIDHGTGVVIGETAEIGQWVRIYQGVTLGAKSFPLDELGNPVKGIPRHPIVEDRVVIYSGATILGRVRIGAGSVIGGNVWLTRSVPPGTHITQAQAREDRFESGGGI